MAHARRLGSRRIIATGTVTHSFLGLQVAPAVSGTNEHDVGGLFIVGVISGGPAASAGLSPGDVITEIDGTPATSAEQLQALTLTRKSGDSVRLAYTRDGSKKTATVTLAAAP